MRTSILITALLAILLVANAYVHVPALKIAQLRTTTSLQRTWTRESKLLQSSSESVTTPNTPPKSEGSQLWNAYLKITDQLTTLFPVWTVLFASLALFKPSMFAWFTTKYFTLSLGKKDPHKNILSCVIFNLTTISCIFAHL